MKKRYVISGILIGIVALLIYLQYGREETIVNTRVSMFDDGYVQEISVIANKLFIGDKERYAEDVIDKVIRNQYRNVYFSYDILGCPEEIKLNVYVDKWDYRYNRKKMVQYIRFREAKVIKSISENREKTSYVFEYIRGLFIGEK